MFKLLSHAGRSTHRPSRAVEHLESRTLFAVPAGFTETRIATGLAQPVAMAFAPDGRLFVTEKPGGVRVIDASGQLLSQKFMQLTVNTEGERGALGIVHDPDFLTNGHLYVYYTATTPTIHNRLSRFTAADADPDPAVYTPGNTVASGSEQVLMEFEELDSIYHNAGSMHFGPDGMLYVSVGDNVRGAVAQRLDNSGARSSASTPTARSRGTTRSTTRSRGTTARSGCSACATPSPSRSSPTPA